MDADYSIHSLEMKAVDALISQGIEGSMDSVRLVIRLAALRAAQPDRSIIPPKFPLIGR